MFIANRTPFKLISAVRAAALPFTVKLTVASGCV